MLDQSCSKYSSKNGTIAFYGEFADDSLRFFRDGIVPITGLAALNAYYSNNPGVLAWTPFDAIVSQSADFGYTYGSAELRSQESDNHRIGYGYYVRIWRKNDDGEWRIVLDVISPAPPPKADYN